MMMLIGGLALLMTIIPLHRQREELAEEMQCSTNMRQIGLAISGYMNAHGSLPPAYIADASGRPLLSWRVLILPYMDIAGLPPFRLYEPWDSPYNLQHLNQFPNLYACPAHDHGKTSGPTDRFTSYFALRGPATAFTGTTPVRLAQITDGADQTLLLVESAHGDVPWSAPVDIDATTGRLTDAAPNTPPGPTAFHKAGIGFIAVDGAFHRLAPGRFKESMNRLSTIAGDKNTPSDTPLTYD
jgi:hypothetical protein